MKTPSLDEIPVIGHIRHLFLSATVKCYRTEHLLSLYIDGQLSDKVVAEVDAHLKECASCRAAKAIMVATGQVLVSREPVQPPAYLSERLRQAIAMEATRPTPIKQASPWVTSRLATVGASFAAVAVISIVLLHHTGSPVVKRVQSIGTPVANNYPANPVALSPEIKLQSHFTTAPHSFNLASLPGSSEAAGGAIKRGVASQHSDKAFIGTLSDIYHAPTYDSVHHEPTLLAKPAKHKSSPSSAVVQTMIANNQPSSTQPGDVTPQQPSLTVTPTLPEQPAASQVADSTVQTPHLSETNNLLRSIALSTQMKQSYSIQANQSAVQLASYSAPGEQLVGSAIR